MSQFFVASAGGSGPIPPTVATQYNTNVNSPAIPALKELNVVGGTITTDNVNGIQTDGSSGSNTLTVQLTNRLVGSVTTTDDTPTALISFSLSGSTASYRFNFDVVGRDTTTGDTVGYNVQGTMKTNGSTATIVETPYIDNDEDASMITADINLIAAGTINPVVAGNNAILVVTGIVGKTISYKSVGTYVMV